MKTFLKQIRDNMFFRLMMVTATTVACVLSIIANNWSWIAITSVLWVLSIWWLLSLHKKQINKVIFLLEALENNDSGLRFQEKGSAIDRKINMLLNKVGRILYETKSEAAQREKYYEIILNSVNTGIIVLNDNGAVFQKNDEALRLLGMEVFTHVKQLNRIDPSLVGKFSEANGGNKIQLTFNNERGSTTLSVRVSDITIRKKHLRILALNDINNELDEKEIDSWIRLTRVLTHEIMNSITPITSLSDTLLTLAEAKDHELRNGLQTISTTGKGLLSFVESYRKLTRIPTPEPALFYVKDFMERMVALAKQQVKYNNIDFRIRVEPSDLILYADERLISQVVINLLNNAIQAIDDRPDSWVAVSCHCNPAEEVLIEISNSGPQIPPEVSEQIFIPFFTTRQGGSGIGLSLSRQIMRLSGGSLTLLSDKQAKETTFVLRF